jgi:hypothetical protein
MITKEGVVYRKFMGKSANYPVACAKIMCEIISYNIHEKKRFYRNQF